MHGALARLLSGGALDPGLPATDLVTAADGQGVVGLLLELPALAEPVATAHREALLAVARREAIRELGALAETRRILQVLGQSGIHPLVLKGGALSQWLYREAWHRPCSDLDLLVADRDAAVLVVEQLRGVGYNLLAGVGPEDADGFEVALVGSRGMQVDLHWRLLNHARLTRYFPYGELLEASLSLPTLHPQARGLGKRHALLHALLHRVTNLANGGGERLIWLWDIHLLTQTLDAGEWNAFLDEATGKEVAMPCLDGLLSTKRVLGAAIPDAILAGLQDASKRERWDVVTHPSQGGMDRAHFAALGWRERGAWVRHKLFPSPEFMRLRYDVQSSPALVLAYLRRWAVGVRRALGGR